MFTLHLLAVLFYLDIDLLLAYFGFFYFEVQILVLLFQLLDQALLKRISQEAETAKAQTICSF